MISRDLAAEYAAALRGTRFADIAPLVAAGVGARALSLAFPAIGTIATDRGTYEPASDGGAAFIMPVRYDFTETPETDDPDGALSDGTIVDLLAFHPARPDRWALRLGIAEWLGAIEPQNMGPDAVPIWRTPMGWLRGECRGLVLLSDDRHARYRLLAFLTAIVAEDDRHAAELRQLLERPWPAPPVLVHSARRAA